MKVVATCQCYWHRLAGRALIAKAHEVDFQTCALNHQKRTVYSERTRCRPMGAWKGVIVRHEYYHRIGSRSVPLPYRGPRDAAGGFWIVLMRRLTGPFDN